MGEKNNVLNCLGGKYTASWAMQQKKHASFTPFHIPELGIILIWKFWHKIYTYTQKSSWA